MQIQKTQIYNSITTVEEMLVYLTGALIQGGAGAKEFVEADNARPEPMAYNTLFRAPDSSYRTVIRVSLPVKVDYLSTTTPFWKKVDQIVLGDLPANFIQP
jgi:hypothetical protein